MREGRRELSFLFELPFRYVFFPVLSNGEEGRT